MSDHQKRVIIFISIFQFFLFSTFPAMRYQGFFSLFDTFSHLRNFFKNVFSVESSYHKDTNMFCPLNKAKPCSAGLVLGWVASCFRLCIYVAIERTNIHVLFTLHICGGLGHQHSKGADGSRYQSIYEPTEPSQHMMSDDVTE